MKKNKVLLATIGKKRWAEILKSPPRYIDVEFNDKVNDSLHRFWIKGDNTDEVIRKYRMLNRGKIIEVGEGFSIRLCATGQKSVKHLDFYALRAFSRNYAKPLESEFYLRVFFVEDLELSDMKLEEGFERWGMEVGMANVKER